MATETVLSAGHLASSIVALNSIVLPLEGGVVAIVIAIIVVILVSNNKKKKAASGGGQPQTPQFPGYGAQQPNPYGVPQQSYTPVGQPDPFAGFADASQQQQPQQQPQQQFAPQQPQQQFAPQQQAPSPGTPPPGTPAGWMPDPSGAPNTLRYWDGNAWTQHVAQRS